MRRSKSLIKRTLKIEIIPNPIKGSGAAFLWGPRQVGKTTFLHEHFKEACFYDLLDTNLCAELSIKPYIFREEVLARKPKLVIVDEIQKIPELLEEIHWLLENTSVQFVLCGSSARKIKRKARNLLGGRAIEVSLFPLTSKEIVEIDLLKILNYGSIPVHYLATKPTKLIKAYVNNYIKEEIIDESLTRNIPAFSKFLKIVGLTHGQQLNYTNIARESGVASNTVRNYYQILKDTLLGFELEPWRKSKKRRMVESSKFYLFDIGIANFLHPEIKQVVAGTDTFGRAFEHFLINEVRTYLFYSEIDEALTYWRTSSGFEVDLIIGNMELAIEIKASMEIRNVDLKGLRALKEEQKVKRAILVTFSSKNRKTSDGIEILPWKDFCSQLWQDQLIQK